MFITHTHTGGELKGYRSRKTKGGGIANPKGKYLTSAAIAAGAET